MGSAAEYPSLYVRLLARVTLADHMSGGFLGELGGKGASEWSRAVWFMGEAAKVM